MIWAIDSSALALLINPAANPPKDPDTQAPLFKARERVEQFIASFKGSDTLIVATPVLAELLVKAGTGGPGVLEQLSGQARIRVRPFGRIEAIELAAMTQEALAAGSKKGSSTEPWQKVKFDRQIIAIARVARATHIYADDNGLANTARSLGMEVVSTWDLEIPAVDIDLLTMLDNPPANPVQHTPRAINLDDDDGADR